MFIDTGSSKLKVGSGCWKCTAGPDQVSAQARPVYRRPQVQSFCLSLLGRDSRMWRHVANRGTITPTSRTTRLGSGALWPQLSRVSVGCVVLGPNTVDTQWTLSPGQSPGMYMTCEEVSFSVVVDVGMAFCSWNDATPMFPTQL